MKRRRLRRRRGDGVRMVKVDGEGMVIMGRNGGMVTSGRQRDPCGDDDGKPMTQTQSTVTIAHGRVRGGGSQGGVEADNNLGTTD